MIRASNQILPKTKVVDLSFLYNFSFDQISSCYMKFGVSVNQNRVKICKCDHCALQCFSCAAPTPYRRCGRRRALHASAVTMSDRQASRAYHSGAVSGFASPFSFLALARSRDELEPPPSTAPAVPRRPRSIPRAPSHLTSPRSSSAPPQV